MTTQIAAQGGLTLGADYEEGQSFTDGPHTYHTAKFLGDPILLTIQVIDRIGFFTKSGSARWVYIGLPKFIWDILTPGDKRDVIGFMYQRESGVAMRGLFPNYGEL